MKMLLEIQNFEKLLENSLMIIDLALFVLSNDDQVK